ncbi:uncharacterized protein G2W53_026499 [Senna tora]|uniref:Uncharacterized protein n=1 Tax=Senna tora TaxID=362788 RepID=A0A834WLA5_9FABA|nr:uncharacterized protein G2W53_026499 [Senna tora]
MAWEERGLSLNILRKTNRCRILENFTNYEAKDLLRNGIDARIGDIMAWEERGSCLNIFQKTNHSQILETFTNYEAKALLGNRHGVGGAWIMYHIPDDKSRSDLRNLHELRGKSLVGQVSETRRFALFAKPSRFDTRIGVVMAWELSGIDARIGVVMAWEEHGSCLNIFRMIYRGRILETFRN